jgi:hypothetical protein
MTTMRTTSSQSGARWGRASTTVHTRALLAMIASTTHDRRCGCRPVKMPIAMPAKIAATTEIVSNAPATPTDCPWATVRYGTPHIKAKTVTENWVPMWVKKPSRVPGRSHTVFRLARVARADIVSVATTRPCGPSLTTASTSTIASTPSAETET